MGRNATYEDAINLQKTKTMQETDRKCPNCGGVMDYDPSILKLHCPYCDYTEDIPENEESKTAQELDFDSAEFTESCDWGAEQKTVTCKACGATTVYDALEVANVCPYCGSNQVMEANDVKTLAPGGVVAFKIDAKEAGQRFTTWLKKKLFCPKAAKESAKAEAFTGVYLPYWTFDANTHTEYSGEYGITKTKKNIKGETESHTDWYFASGSLDKFIDDELVCGTTQHDEQQLRQIEPFDTTANVTYRPEYIAGFAAERYSIGLKAAWEKAKAFISTKLKRLCEQKMMDEHNGDCTRGVTISTEYANITYKYLLLPIWISSFTYKGKIYQFMVNGQTGKVGGKSPVSALRVIIAILIVLLIIWFIAFLSN